MCGIVGYIGQNQAIPVLVNGLRRLEYRGYDSAGLAVVDVDGLRTHRAAGKVALQLLSYHIARHRGCEIDQPRNLAKSVTVE